MLCCSTLTFVFSVTQVHSYFYKEAELVSLKLAPHWFISKLIASRLFIHEPLLWQIQCPDFSWQTRCELTIYLTFTVGNVFNKQLQPPSFFCSSSVLLDTAYFFDLGFLQDSEILVVILVSSHFGLFKPMLWYASSQLSEYLQHSAPSSVTRGVCKGCASVDSWG